jgi:hypothetical protein
MKSKVLSDQFKTVNFIIGILATLMMFFPILIFKDSDTSFNGFEVSFGKEFANLGSWVSGQITFNPLVLLALLLPIVAVLIILSIDKGYMIASVLFVVAAAMILMIPQFTVVTVTILDQVNEVDVSWTYGIGLIFAAGLSILGAGLSFLRVYQTKKKVN